MLAYYNSRKNPGEAPLTHQNPPEWSDWHERLLCAPDAPDAIQCRHCNCVKRATNANFRNIRTTDRWRTTCRACERKSQYHRSMRGKFAAINNDPRLPDAARAVAVQAAVQQKRDNKAKAAKLARFDSFRLQWRWVAKIVAARRAMLQVRVLNSRNQNETCRSTLAQCMADSRNVADYINAVLALYSTVAARLRNADVWLNEIGYHLPPANWMEVVAKLSSGAYTERQINPELMRVSPWEFTTHEERAALLSMHPRTVQGIGHPTTAAFEMLIDKGTIGYHICPERMPRDVPALTPPEWLKTYNGGFQLDQPYNTGDTDYNW